MEFECPACGNEGIHACCGGMEFEPLSEEFGKAIDENFWELVSKETPEAFPMFMSERFYEEHFTDLVKTLGMDHFHRADKEEDNQNE